MVPVLRLTHVGIAVSDLERALRFYRDALGFRFEHDLHVEGEPSDTLLRLRGVNLDAAYLVRPDGYVALADPQGRAAAITSYLDARRLIVKH